MLNNDNFQSKNDIFGQFSRHFNCSFLACTTLISYEYLKSQSFLHSMSYFAVNIETHIAEIIISIRFQLVSIGRK